MRVRRRSVVAGGLFALVPGVGFALEVLVYVADGTTPTGPFDEAGLRERIKSRAEAAQTMVWHEGMADWAPADRVVALAAFVASLPEKTPVDFSTFIIGKWIEENAKVKMEIEADSTTRLFPANLTWSFQSDGTYTHGGNAEWTKMTPRLVPQEPSGFPQTPIYRLQDDSVKITVKETGTYKVIAEDSDTFVLDADGKVTVSSNLGDPKKSDRKEAYRMHVVGPDHFVSDDGQNFRRTSI